MIETMINYLMSFVGRPYIWAGNGSGATYGGFDCSGLVLEGLWATGLYSGPDTSSDGLLKLARKSWKIATKNERGAILFFGTSKKASHVAVAIGNGLMIEAGGGGSSCTTSANSTGFVRIRPIDGRKDLIGSYLP